MSTINGKACVANGRNLLIDTDFNNLDLWFANKDWTKQADKYNGLAVMQTTDDWGGISQYVKVKTGEVYTFSLYARYTSGTGSSNIYWSLNTNPESGHVGANVSPAENTVNLSDNWQRISVTTTITSDGYIRPRIERSSNNSNVLQIAGMKLETGTLATPLTPVPVDKVFSNGKQVYGRNYILNSDKYLTGAGKQQSHVGDISGDTLKKLRGKQVTISVDVSYTNARHEVGQNCRIGIEFFITYESGQQQYHGAWKKTTAGESYSGRISQTTIFKDEPIISTSAEIWAYAQDVFDESSVGRTKLEIGSVATPWTPAPEDVLK